MATSTKKRNFMPVKEFGKNPKYVQGGDEPEYLNDTIKAITEPKECELGNGLEEYRFGELGYC